MKTKVVFLKLKIEGTVIFLLRVCVQRRIRRKEKCCSRSKHIKRKQQRSKNSRNTRGIQNSSCDKTTRNLVTLNVCADVSKVVTDVVLTLCLLGKITTKKNKKCKIVLKTKQHGSSSLIDVYVCLGKSKVVIIIVLSLCLLKKLATKKNTK